MTTRTSLEASPAAATAPFSVLLLLFLLSGASGLMLEVVWSRMLATVLGATTWGLLTILATYMGGLGLGAILFGSRVERSNRPLRIYAILEASIGLYASAMPLLLGGVSWVYVRAAAWDDSSGLALAWVTRIATAVAVLIVPTTLLGGTYPALVRAVALAGGGVGRRAATLYAANTAGAVVGCFTAGFLIIPALGVLGTNRLAAGIDLAVAAAAWMLHRPATPIEGEPQARSTPNPATRSVLSGPVVLVIAGFTGYCGLAFEVLWTRGLLVALVDNTTYAFSMMLSAFLLGHALGSGWFGGRRATARDHDPGARLAWVLAAAGIAALASFPILIATSEVVSRVAYGPDVTFWGRRIPIQFALCTAVIGPTAALLGGAFALAIRSISAETTDAAGRAGRIYAANTLGAILGAVITQVFAIPYFGTQTSLAVLALGLILAGAAVSFATHGWKAISGVAAMLVVGAAAFVGERQLSLIDLYVTKERLRTADAPAKLLGVIESPGAVVTIHERAPGDRVINLNGTNVAGTNPVLRTIQTLQGELPVLLHPKPEAILQIGFGSGGTYATLDAMREASTSIEVLELTPEVIVASERWLSEINSQTLTRSSDRVTINDARSHMASTSRTYDLVLSDSIHPRFRGNAALYSRDYFELCAGRLRPGGIFSTWLPLYGISTDDLRGILATLQSVFPHVQVWYPNAEPNENTILLGSLTPIVLDFDRIALRMATGATSPRAENRLRLDPVRLLDFFVLDSTGVRRFAAGGVVSTDDRPHLEFRAPLTLRRQESWLKNLEGLAAARESVVPLVEHLPESRRAELERWVAGTRFKLEGQIAELRGDFSAAVDAYDRCLAINPDDRETRKRRDGLARLPALR
ncbi:MAG: fused MFS/spermidine synthase [Isosphaeraceae bacterium]|nr:fused MFS/spermidine synthase [Isosphaeraceae bacterium]